MLTPGKFALLVALLAGTVAASPAAGPRNARKARAKVVQPPPPQATEVQPTPPAPPPTPEQLPAVAPKVQFQNGQLTIAAENSTLGDVLREVKAATGASLDVAPSANSERVFVHLGPGNPRDVLGQLLAGSKFDYIILGTSKDPAAVQQIILTARGGAAGAAAGNAGGSPATAQNRSPQPVDNDGAVDEDTVQQPEPAPPTAQEQAPAPSEPPQQPAPGQPNPNGQVKTPEELLQELQRMQRPAREGPVQPPTPK